MALIWTEPADVTDRWLGSDIPATDEQLTRLLEDAEDTILREFPDLPERLAADPPAVPLLRVQKVAARMVIRLLRNPEGYRQVQEGAGAFTEGRTFGGSQPGEMYLTDEDRADLGNTREGRAFTIDQTPEWPEEAGPAYWFQLGMTYRP
ncbi:hypothetical protein [Promicromonospora kroppenstedtii]|uniref:hypothetical protein n=1 Tax=Promicromonospora kroppenstedtii TaxID=440482 RepID=UPI0004B93D8A|nr:hypothetical protein [Promicromonospora kroppenstedtii]